MLAEYPPTEGWGAERLRELGIRRMVMISGDNQRVADAVAGRVGLDEARGDLLPEDKVETIQQLRSEQKVAMVGDGVNDAPALRSADIGVADSILLKQGPLNEDEWAEMRAVLEE